MEEYNNFIDKWHKDLVQSALASKKEDSEIDADYFLNLIDEEDEN